MFQDPTYEPFDKIIWDVVHLTEGMVLIIVDWSTRFVIGEVISDETAITVADILLKEVVLRFGRAPKILQTDNAPGFRSTVVQELCALINTYLSYSSGYAPQTQGPAERFNRNLIDQLTHDYLQTEEDRKHLSFEWRIRKLISQYNSRTHAVTRKPPVELLFGVPPRLPTNAELEVENVHKVTENRLNLLTNLRTAAVEKQRKRINNLLKKEERRLPQERETSYEIGDFVKVNLNRRSNLKEETEFEGPFQIVGKIGKKAYELDIPSDVYQGGKYSMLEKSLTKGISHKQHKSKLQN